MVVYSWPTATNPAGPHIRLFWLWFMLCMAGWRVSVAAGAGSHPWGAGAPAGPDSTTGQHSQAHPGHQQPHGSRRNIWGYVQVRQEGRRNCAQYVTTCVRWLWLWSSMLATQDALANSSARGPDAISLRPCDSWVPLSPPHLWVFIPW